ncbi:MAG: ATP-dependent DNA ligase [Flavisolibacter sp.]|jgi:DNA ligase-1|nr:ATP-dependent DNA ligase [Flavisolibacter sp.]
MRDFAELIMQLGSSTKTNDKLDALVHYFSEAGSRDKVWVIALFTDRKPKRPVNSTLLAQWCTEMASIEWWLFEESYHVVGDLAETIALLLPETEEEKEIIDKPLHYYIEKLIAIGREPEAVKKDFILGSWNEMNQAEKFVFNKMFTGGFRIGVSQKLIVNALAKTVDLSPSVIAHRISGNWDPSAISFEELLSEHTVTQDLSKPYPFFLAYAIEGDVTVLGDPSEWMAEWKWDGIRGELIQREGAFFVWSRGEELMTDKFPEYQPLKHLLPDGVALDGEIICMPETKPGDAGIPLPFSFLQTRIGRKNVSKKQLKAAPVGFICYDLLEFEGQDIREWPLVERRKKLKEIIEKVQHPSLLLSPEVDFDSWEALKEMRSQSRDMFAEGIMLKRKSSAYQVGRKRGDWWKWKIDALTIDAVMIYAQKGAGKRSNLYTAYTFAVRDGEQLIPFTRAYSGLTDKEIAEVDYFVKRNAIEKFGPVRTVKPELVFEIAFEGIAASKRHKSGVALRFPRISRWRRDKPPSEINTLDDLRDLLKVYGNKL